MSGIPAKDVVLTADPFATGGFYDADTGQQPPVQLVAVGSFQEISGIRLHRAAGKELVKRVEPGVTSPCQGGKGQQHGYQDPHYSRSSQSSTAM